MFKAYIDAWKKCMQWYGRTGRRDYWFYMIADAIIILVSFLLIFEVPEFFDLDYYNEVGVMILLIILWWGYSIVSLLPALAVTIRRLHDVNKPGWYFLISLVPIIGNAWYFITVCTKGTHGDNDFGPDPKGTVYYNPEENEDIST